MTLAIWAVAFAIAFHAIWKKETIIMAMSPRVAAALAALASSISNLAAAIRNPAVPTNDDDTATALEGIVGQIDALTAEENAEDNPTPATTTTAVEPGAAGTGLAANESMTGGSGPSEPAPDVPVEVDPSLEGVDPNFVDDTPDETPDTETPAAE